MICLPSLQSLVCLPACLLCCACRTRTSYLIAAVFSAAQSLVGIILMAYGIRMYQCSYVVNYPDEKLQLREGFDYFFYPVYQRFFYNEEHCNNSNISVTTLSSSHSSMTSHQRHHVNSLNETQTTNLTKAIPFGENAGSPSSGSPSISSTSEGTAGIFHMEPMESRWNDADVTNSFVFFYLILYLFWGLSAAMLFIGSLTVPYRSFIYTWATIGVLICIEDFVCTVIYSTQIKAASENLETFDGVLVLLREIFLPLFASKAVLGWLINVFMIANVLLQPNSHPFMMCAANGDGRKNKKGGGDVNEPIKYDYTARYSISGDMQPIRSKTVLKQQLSQLSQHLEEEEDSCSLNGDSSDKFNKSLLNSTNNGTLYLIPPRPSMTPSEVLFLSYPKADDVFLMLKPKTSDAVSTNQAADVEAKDKKDEVTMKPRNLDVEAPQSPGVKGGPLFVHATAASPEVTFKVGRSPRQLRKHFSWAYYSKEPSRTSLTEEIFSMGSYSKNSEQNGMASSPRVGPKWPLTPNFHISRKAPDTARRRGCSTYLNLTTPPSSPKSPRAHLRFPVSRQVSAPGATGVSGKAWNSAGEGGRHEGSLPRLNRMDSWKMQTLKCAKSDKVF